LRKPTKTAWRVITMMKIIEKRKLKQPNKRARNGMIMIRTTEKKHKKKVSTRIMGKYWGDKSYNEKIKTSLQALPKNA
jgi:hypothetical protein